MFVEIVKFKNNVFKRDLINRSNLEASDVLASDVIAYRFIQSPAEETDIHSWNLSAELSKFSEVAPCDTTPEVLYIYKNTFLKEFVDIFNKICSETDLDPVSVSNAMLNYDMFHGKLSMLCSENVENLISLLKQKE